MKEELDALADSVGVRNSGDDAIISIDGYPLAIRKESDCVKDP